MGQRSLESVSVDWGRSVLRPHRSRKLAALARGRPPIGTRLVTALGTVSALYQPIWKGGEAIGVETQNVLGEHERLSAIGGIDLDPQPTRTPGAPLLFILRDPDGNHIIVVEESPAA